MSSPVAMRTARMAAAVFGLMLGACSSAPAGPTTSPAGPTATAGVATQSSSASSSPSVGSIKDTDICALISAAEVKATAGFDVAEGKRLKLQTETAGCQWNGTDKSGIQFVTISVSAFREDGWFPPDANEPNSEIVSGVGDEAYRKEIGLSGTAGDLVVKSGGLVINITLFDDRRAFKKLHPLQVVFAKLLISRL